MAEAYRSNWKTDVKRRLLATFRRAMSRNEFENIDQEQQQILPLLHGTKPDPVLYDRAAHLQQQVRATTLLVNTLPEFRLALEKSGFNKEEIRDELARSQSELNQLIEQGECEFFEGYGLRILRIDEETFAIEPSIMCIKTSELQDHLQPV